ncbi:FUSC family protein [Alicyclobacillus fodiniaquatilis]|uniref:FUSC family protein n=1 Tax=Alicyclobacillus fodiniaquatilis TaxID=1661150 RepID=A0ABW4JF18_9BACL
MKRKSPKTPAANDIHSSNDVKRSIQTLPPTRLLRHAFHFRKAPSPWRRAIGAGLSLFVPIVCGIAIGHPLWGLMATMGGFAGIYATDSPPKRLAVKLLIVVIGLSISVALGTLSAGSPWSIAIMSAVVAACATFISGALQVPPPGPYFFIMACEVGTGMPLDPGAAGTRLFFALIGGAIAWSIGMGSCFWQRRVGRSGTDKTYDSTVQRLGEPGMWLDASARLRAALRRDSIVWPASIRIAIGIFVATLIAYALGDDRPYWVPLGCAAVLLGTHVMATIHRAIQRAIGTSIGIILTGWIFSLHPSFLVLAVLCLVLQTVVELFVVRNYGLAVIFITPLALIVAMTANTGMTPLELVHARLVDNILGCCVGLAMGLLLWRRAASRRLRLVAARAIRSEGDFLQAVLSSQSDDPGDYASFLREMGTVLSHLDDMQQTALHEFPHRAPVTDELWPTIAATKHVAEALQMMVKERDQVQALRILGEQCQIWFEAVAKSVERNGDFINRGALPFADLHLGLTPALLELQASVTEHKRTVR